MIYEFNNQLTSINNGMSEENPNEKRELDVSNLVSKLKESVQQATGMKNDNFVLDKSELEQFILNNTGKLIKDSMDTIDDIKQYIISAPEPDDVHSLAELYKASTSAIESLNKILIQQQKSATQITVKKMDIDSKHSLQNSRDENSITFTRDEVFKKLVDSGNIIETKPADEEDL